jgi:hypothetical protein
MYNSRPATFTKVVEPNRAALPSVRSMRAAIIRTHPRRQWFIRRSSWLLYYHTANIDKA